MNIKTMQKKNVPINLETIYFAHHFGASMAGDVYLGNPTKKLKLNGKIMKANPWLKNRKIRTTGDLRDYIKDRLKDGAKQYQSKTGIQLTLN